MSIDKAEIRRIARLAHLEKPRVLGDNGQWAEPESHLIDEATLDKLAADLTQILEYVDQLKEVDTEGVEPTSHGVPLPTLFREDAERDGLAPDDALAATPVRVGNAVSVPKIVE